MRKLKGTDVFAALRLVNELEIEDTVKMVAERMDKTNTKELGIALITKVLGSCSTKRAEELFWELFAGPLEMKPEELADMDPLEAINLIKGLADVIDVEGYRNFFKSLAGLLGRD